MKDTHGKRGKHTSSTYRNIGYSSATGRSTKKRKHKHAHANNQYNKLNLKKVILVIAIPILLIIAINVISTIQKRDVKTGTNGNIDNSNDEVASNNQPIANEQPSENEQNNGVTEEPNQKVQIDDWRLTLANYDNLLPEDFEVELADIDSSRQFDARAIKYLDDMINAIKKAGHTNIWVQSAFRSVKRQKELFDNSVNKYLKQGKTQEEAEALTLEYINKPGGSDHNLGLAVDFNYVDNSFAETPEYKWLLENAEDYGFILRYPKDKEDITKIEYESWHWRFVGEEHAKRMNELNMCLEEYVEYLESGNT